MKKSKSILWAWTLSYICLLIIPILSVFINYYSNERKLRQEYLHAYELTLNNISIGIDSLTDDMQQFYYYILQNDSFDIMKQSTSPNDNFYYHAYHFQAALNLFHVTNSALNCAVYNSHLGFVSSVQNSCNIAQYHEYLQAFSQMIPEYEEWCSFISSEYKTTYFINHNISTSNSPNLIFANTLSRSTAAPVNIFITVPLTEITALTSYLPDNTYLVLQTAENNFYYFDNSGLFSPDSASSAATDNQLLLPHGAVSIADASAKSNLTYHMVITKDAIASDLYNVKKNFVLNLTITLLLSLVGIFILLRLNYRPISELLFKFSITPASGNELTKIASTYEQLQKDYHASRLTVQHQKEELFSRHLLALLKGRISPLDLQQKNTLDIDFQSSFALIGFWLPVPVQQDIEYDELNFFIVNNIFCELFHGNTFYHIEDGRYVFYLFDLNNVRLDAETPLHTSWSQYALDKVNYMCNLINEKCNFSIVGVVSEVIENIGNCKFLYRKVLESFEYHNLSSGIFSIDARTVARQKNEEHVREHIDCELTTALTNGDLNAALQVSDQIFPANNDIPFSTQRIYAFDSFMVVIDAFNNYTSNPIHINNALNYTSLLIQADNADTLKGAFNKLLEYVCEIISEKSQLET